MATTRTMIRVLSWVVAVTTFLGTILFLGLAFDLLVPLPYIDPATDFVDNLVAGGDVQRQRWPYDMASSLLYAAGFTALILLARPLADIARPRDARARVMTAALAAAGIIGLAAQLIYVGARQLTAEIAYCDCGYREVEVIAQAWAGWLVDGSVAWLVNGTGVLLLVGLAAAGAAVGGYSMPRGWQLVSWLTALVLAFSVIVGALGIEGPLGSLLVGVEIGVLLPAWAAWLALRAPEGPDGDHRPDDAVAIESVAAAE